MKKYFFESGAMLILGGLMASCTHDDYGYSSIVESKKAAFQEVFVNTYGKIDPNQTWGFTNGDVAAATRGITRAVDPWTLTDHDDSWMEDLNFGKPSNYIEVKSDTQLEGSNTYYVPSTFTGTLSFKDNFAGNIYVDAKLTGYSGQNLGTVNIYILKDGSWDISQGISTGTVTIYNQGILILGAGGLNSQNLKKIYNGGAITMGDGTKVPDIADGISIFSNSEGTFEIIGDETGTETDLKFACDIHGTLNVTGNLKIQNGRTQYVCGLVVTGTLNMTQGNLQSAYVEADEITFDGAWIKLLPEGHVVANKISMSNSGTYIYGHTDSHGLVEATDWYFRNHNNFESAFSSNVYFQVDGSIDIEEILTRDNGQNDDVSTYYATLAEYLASQNGKELDASRFNGEVSGSPACGAPYGNTDVTIPTDKSETTGERTEVVTTTKTYETTELIEQGRVFCEDLGKISTNDLDFNDVVFDAYVYKVTPSTQTIVKENGVQTSSTEVEGTPTYKTAIVLLAAGGTLQLTLAGREVHNELGGEPTSTIINTITDSEGSYGNAWTTHDPVILGEDFEYSSIVEIPIIVLYGNGETLELTADMGWAPHKILVPIGTKWCLERVNIAEAYTDFKNYVGNSQGFWDGNVVDSKLYPSEPSYTLTTRTGKVLTGENSETTYRDGEGSSTTGGYQGETILSRERR